MISRFCLRNRTWLLCLAAFLSLLTLMVIWLKIEKPHDDYLVFLPAAQQTDGGDPSVIVQEIICPKGAEHCFKVEDYYTEEEGDNSRRGERKYQRRLMVDSVADVVLSVADLAPANPDEPFSAQNALHWSVQKHKLGLQYIKGIIGQMFATECIKLGRRRRTLMVGLGGGTIPNILAELEPKNEIVSIELEPAVEYIARKWFGLEETSKQKLIIRDGLNYIEQEWKAETAGRFDCLIIDACQNTKPEEGMYPLMCPLEGFVSNERMVKKLFQMVTAKGTLLINTFVVEDSENRDKVAEQRQLLLELFRYQFGHCYYATLPFNKILVCSLTLSDREPMTDELYRERISELPSWLQTELEAELNIEHEVWRPKSEIK